MKNKSTNGNKKFAQTLTSPSGNKTKTNHARLFCSYFFCKINLIIATLI